MSKSLLAVLFLAFGTFADAQDYSWLDNPQLLVLRARVDAQTRLLFVEGENFGDRRLPAVSLDDQPLTVRESTSTTIEAGPLPPGIGPGSHILRVVAGDDRSRFDVYSLEIDGEIPPAAPPLRSIPRAASTRAASIGLKVLDDDGDVGWSPSMAIGADGLPLIAYLDYANLDLKTVHCVDPACNDVRHTVVDSEGDIGWSIDLAIGIDGLPVIAFFDKQKRKLKFAQCHDSGCFRTTISVIETGAAVGKFVGIAVPADGLPVISFYDLEYRDLMIALCRSSNCRALLSDRSIALAISVGIMPSPSALTATQSSAISTPAGAI